MVKRILGGDMDYDQEMSIDQIVEKAKQSFLADIQDVEKHSIETLVNKGPLRKEKEAEDAAAFENYMDSDDYKIFCKEVSKK